MTRVFRWAAIVYAVTGMSALGIGAQQLRTAKDGVYSEAQATRGAMVYQARCASCHGAKLEGNLGPPLAGSGFLETWGAQPLTDLADKIGNTMPYDAPRTLSETQVVDLVSHILQTNQFPAGRTDLQGGAALQQVTLVGINTSERRPRAGGDPAPPFTATGSLNQIMRGILFPSSNVLFDVQTQDPTAAPKGGTAHTDASATTVRYGSVYAPWEVVDAAAISIAETGPILMTAGRRCENGKPVPVERADWQQYVEGVVSAGRAAYKASQSRNQAAVADATNVISDACANCHRVYRDVASAAMRCTPPK